MLIATALVTLGNIATGQADGALLMFYLWPIPFAATFFSMRVVAVQSIWLGLTSALLMLTPIPGVVSSQPQRLPSHWLFLIASCGVLGSLGWALRRRLDRHVTETGHILELSRAVNDAVEANDLRRVLASWETGSHPGASLAALMVATRSSLHHQERADLQVMTDPVTGLGNRTALSAYLSGVRGAVSVLTVGVNGWRDITDAYGLESGDEVARLLSARLVSAAPRSGLYRIDCDSFAVVDAGPRSVSLRERAERIRSACSAPLDLPSGQLHVSLSLGATSSDGLRPRGDALMRATILDAHNRERAAYGSNPLVWDNGLEADALAVLHEWRDHELLRRALGIFGLSSLGNAAEAPTALTELARRRDEARAARDYAEADRLRAEIEAAGWEVRDEAGGHRLVRRP